MIRFLLTQALASILHITKVSNNIFKYSKKSRCIRTRRNDKNLNGHVIPIAIIALHQDFFEYLNKQSRPMDPLITVSSR